jgi:hypothetical protein
LRYLKKGAVELLPGKLAGLYDVRMQLWRRMDYLPDTLQNCKVHATAMLKGLAQGTLLLFDLGYFSFEWLDALSQRKLWFVCRLREKTSYTVLHTFYTFEEVFDGVVWLGNYQAQAGQAVRLVRFRVGALTLGYRVGVFDAQRALGLASVVEQQGHGHLSASVGLPDPDPTVTGRAPGNRLPCPGRAL